MKKKLIYTCTGLVFLFAVTNVNAQIQKGNILAGSDIAGFNLGLDKGGNFNMIINPKAAWFVKDYTAIGTYLTFGFSTATGAGSDVSYGIGALGRYYLTHSDPANMVQRSTFFLEGNVGIEGDNPSVGDNTNGLGIGVGPGWTHFFTSSLALEALFKYNGIIGFGSSPTSNNLNLSIGFQIYLPSAKIRSMVKEVKP